MSRNWTILEDPGESSLRGLLRGVECVVMRAEEWEEVKDRFHQALAQPKEQRQAFLVRACSGDTVRLEVERLLASRTNASDFLKRPLMEGTSTDTLDPLPATEAFNGTPRFT